MFPVFTHNPLRVSWSGPSRRSPEFSGVKSRAQLCFCKHRVVVKFKLECSGIQRGLLAHYSSGCTQILLLVGGPIPCLLLSSVVQLCAVTQMHSIVYGGQL